MPSVRNLSGLVSSGKEDSILNGPNEIDPVLETI